MKRKIIKVLRIEIGLPKLETIEEAKYFLKARPFIAIILIIDIILYFLSRGKSNLEQIFVEWVLIIAGIILLIWWTKNAEEILKKESDQKSSEN